jgi:hypothetical protein
MTTFTYAPGTDVHPDVRTEAHSHRHPGQHRRTNGLWLSSPWWLVSIVATTVSVLLSLGVIAYSIPTAG